MGWGAEWLSDEVRSRGPRSPGGWLALVSHREDISSEAMRKGGGQISLQPGPAGSRGSALHTALFLGEDGAEVIS